MGEMKGIDHADVLPVRMSRLSTRQRQLVITFTDEAAASFFDTVPDGVLVDAIVEALRGC